MARTTKYLRENRTTEAAIKEKLSVFWSDGVNHVGGYSVDYNYVGFFVDVMTEDALVDVRVVKALVDVRAVEGPLWTLGQYRPL